MFRICEGIKSPSLVLREQISRYKEVFIKTTEQVTYFIAYYQKNYLFIMFVILTIGRKNRSVFRKIFKSTACCFPK